MTTTPIEYRFEPSPVSTTTPPTCSVWLDGVRMADGQPGEDELDPAVLTDLRVEWGRTNSLDQPSPATCSFRVIDLAGGQKFLDTVHIGARVDVRTDGTVFGDPSIPMLPALPLANAYLVNGTLDAATGWVTPTDARKAVTIRIPPAPLSSDPTAWNAVPRTKASQTWQAVVGLTLQLDLGTALQRVTVAPLSYVNPDGSGAQAQPVIGTVEPGYVETSPGISVHTIAAEFQPPEDVWVGLVITLNPTGPAWRDPPVGVRWDTLGDTPAWRDLARIKIDPVVELLAPPESVQYSSLVFSGRVTDLAARYDLDLGGGVIEVIAEDHTADLANRYVGDKPWLAEPLGDRFAAIVDASGQAIEYQIDPGAASLPIAWRDVDAQPTTRLLQELAISAGGVLWSATSLVSGPYLWLEDVNSRQPTNALVKDPDGVIRIHPVAEGSWGTVTVSACSVLLEPVEWVQTQEDNSTQVEVSWYEEGLDGDGLTMVTQRTESRVDREEEQRTGRRRIGITSQLADAVSAVELAATVLARVRTPGWRISGLTWQLNADEPLSSTELLDVLRILDGTVRIGLPILLTELPPWSPVGTDSIVPLYLEGGRYSNLDGRWTLELLVSDAASQGQAAARWVDLPVDWLWEQLDPAISWDELTGVGV